MDLVVSVRADSCIAPYLCFMQWYSCLAGWRISHVIRPTWLKLVGKTLSVGAHFTDKQHSLFDINLPTFFEKWWQAALQSGAKRDMLRVVELVSTEFLQIKTEDSSGLQPWNVVLWKSPQKYGSQALMTESVVYILSQVRLVWGKIVNKILR